MWTVKTVANDMGDWLLDVLGVPYGTPNDRDRHNEFFTPHTNLHFDKYGLPPVVYYHGFDPENGKPAGEPVYIGSTTSREVRADGVWYRVVLDKRHELAKRVWQAAQRLAAFASSGSANHLVRVAKNGEVLHWPVIELSLFDIDPAMGRVPANNYAIARPVLKAMYPQHIQGGDVDERQIQEMIEKTLHDVMAKIDFGTQIRTVVQEVLSAEHQAERQKAAEAATAETKRQDEIQDAVKEARKKWEADAATERRLPGPPAIRQFADLDRYDSLDAGEQALLISLMGEAERSRLVERGPSEAAFKALIIKLEEDHKSQTGSHGRSALLAAGFNGGVNAVRSLMGSTIAGFGDEWVGTTWATSLWEKIRLATFAMSKLRTVEIPQGSDTLPIPVEGSGFTFFRVVDATTLSASGWPNATIPASRSSTSTRALNPKKLGARCVYDGDMDEDAVIPFLPWMRDSLVKDGAEVIESLFLDGHVATSADSNINLAVGTPNAENYYLIFDGVRALALAINSSNSRDAGAALSEDDYLLTARLMGVNGRNALDRNKVEFIIDPSVHFASLQIPAVKTRDVNSNPSIENGNLIRIWGYNVNVSGQMCKPSAVGLSNAVGRISATEADNTRGTIAAVRWDQWVMGMKRRMRLETTRIPRADSTEIVATMRIDVVSRDNEAAAISYNVAV